MLRNSRFLGMPKIVRFSSITQKLTKEDKKMVEGRCMKCKKQVEIKDAKETSFKGKAGEMAAMTGTCPVCGTKVFRITGKKK